MRERMTRDHEKSVALAWSTERLAREKLLKPLRSYLVPANPAAEMLAHLRAMQKQGKALTIERVVH